MFAVFLSALLSLTPGLTPSDREENDDGTGLTIDLAADGPSEKVVNPPVLGPAGRPLVVIDPGH
ncbi:MAG TPA: hypothetical protein VK391_06910, partial [Allosphingosinicella sp.]|nr:hypothetical protein [Allosphingosinicella sp.]